MTTRELYDFIHPRKLAVISSVSAFGLPESALIGIAVTEDLELVFDTVKASRKFKNLSRNSSTALVIGWDGEETVQYEGIAREASPNELERYRAIYFAAFPDGYERAAWPDIAYLIVRPHWIRYSDFRTKPEHIEEFKF
jgi:pyridoxine/pyridoxamine 5'-phosphate oxidase